MNCIRSNNLDLKYYMLKLSGCKDIWIRKSEFAIQLNVFFGPLKKGSYWLYPRIAKSLATIQKEKKNN